MTTEVRVVDDGDGVAVLTWEARLGPIDAEAAAEFQAAATAATEQALAAGIRRVEATVPAADRWARRAVLRSGFRQEGVRRAALARADGTFDDLVLYARLAGDVVGGSYGFSGVMNSVLPRKRLIAHVLMRHPDGRILLCDTAFKADWELPGGVVEPGEAPRDGAVREVREELGIDLAVGGLLVADWLPPYLGWDDAVEMIFDGGLVTEDQLAGFSLQENEIRGIELVTLDAAADLVTPLSHRRLSVAVGQSGGGAPGAGGTAPGVTVYLQDGRRV